MSQLGFSKSKISYLSFPMNSGRMFAREPSNKTSASRRG